MAEEEQNTDNQTGAVAEDQERQRERQEQYKEQLLQDRARQHMVKGNLGANSATIGREAAKLAGKETFDKFKSALGEGDSKFKTTQRTGEVWMLALVIAIAKDLMDIATFESVAWFDWVVDLIFGAVFWVLLGTSVRKGARFLKSIGPAILEAIPILGFLPIWSITVAYMYFKSQQEE